MRYATGGLLCLLILLSGVCGWAEDSYNPLAFLLGNPETPAVGGQLTQNESSLAIDLERRDAGIQDTLTANPGDTIQGAVIIDNIDAYQGFTLSLLITPTDVVNTPNSVVASPGDLPDPASNSGSVFLGDLLLQENVSDTGSPVTSFPSTVFNFDIPIRSDFPGGDVTVEIIRNDNEEVLSIFAQNFIIIPDPENPGSTINVNLDPGVITLFSGTVTVGAQATATPTATETPTPTATNTPLLPPPTLLAPTDEVFILIDDYNSTPDLHQWTDVGGARYKFSRTLASATEEIFTVTGTSLGSNNAPTGYEITDPGVYTWSVTGLTALDLEGARSEERVYVLDFVTQTPTPTLSATPTNTPPPTETPTPTELGDISGRVVLDRDLLVPRGQTLLIKAGAELVFQANTDTANIGRYENLSELIVEGALVVEDGDLPAIIKSEFIPTPTPTPTQLPPTQYPTPPFFDLSRIGEELSGFSNIAPVLADVSRDGLVDHLFLGNQDGLVYISQYLGDGVFTEQVTPAVSSMAGQSPPQFETIDVGEKSVPWLVDANRNGLLDLFVGGEDGRIRAYQNVADSTSDIPIFEQVFDEFLRFDGQDNPFIEVTGPAAPALFDLNDDGIIDLVLGTGDGQMFYFQGISRTGDSTDFFNETSFASRLFANPEEIDTGNLAPRRNPVFQFDINVPGPLFPSIADYDEDGDYDILAGAADGFIRLWENRLAQGEFVFPFGDDAPGLNYPKFPRFYYYDRDNGLLLRQGEEGFELISAEERPIPSMGNLGIGSPYLDLVVGDANGGFQVFTNISELGQTPEEPEAKSTLVKTERGLDQLDQSGMWGGVWFKDSSIDTQSDVRNLIISDAKIGIQMDSASPQIEKTDILFSRQYGIVANRLSFPSIKNAVISAYSDNSLAGVLADNYSAPVLEDVTLINNGLAGLHARRYAYPIVRGSDPISGHSLIANNQFGVRIDSQAAPRLGNLLNSSPGDDGLIEFRNNKYYDIFNDTTATIDAQNNFWGSADVNLIDARIYDDDENPLKGKVEFIPVAGSILPPQMGEPTATPTPRFIHFPRPTQTPTPEAPVLEVSGIIDTNTVWEGEVLITGNVSLVNGNILEIKPGTLVRFAEKQPKIKLEAQNSTIIARGTRNRPIIFMPETFTSEDPMPGTFDPPYVGIGLEGPSVYPSHFEYCEFRFGNVGLDISDQSPRVENCEFTANRKAVILRSSGNYPMMPTFRKNIFDLNEGVLQTLGPVRADFGTPVEGGLNSFLVPDESSQRFDFEILTRLPQGSIQMAGNYFLARQTRDGNSGQFQLRRLERYEALRVRFSLGALFEETQNPEGAVNVFPLGTVLNDGLSLMDEGEDLFPNIEITQPEVWAGQIYVPQTVTIFSEVRILPGSEILVAATDGPHYINVGGGTFYGDSNRVVQLNGVLLAEGRPSFPIRIRTENRQPSTWAGIFFTSQNVERRSLLEYCEISDGMDQVMIMGSSPQITGCELFNYTGAGIRVMDMDSMRAFSALNVLFIDPISGALDVADDDEITVFVPQNPFGVAMPHINENEFSGGEFGVLSENSSPTLRGNIMAKPARIASVFVVGPNTPDLGTVVDPGLNLFSSSDDFALVNLSQAEISAVSNAWVRGGADIVQTAAEADELVLDNEENPASGRARLDYVVQEIGSLKPMRRQGNLIADDRIDANDIKELIRIWHTVKGDKEFNDHADFNKSRQIDHKDLFFLSSQWKRHFKGQK
jgi:hypothetical protein